MTKQHHRHTASGSKSVGLSRIAAVRVVAAVLALVPFLACAFNWSDYPAGAVVTVTGNATATDADMATINAYSKLCFASGTRITFDVSGDVSLTCSVAATGTIVKCGSGSLALATSSVNGSINTYRYVDFEVEEGMLKLPQDNFTLTDIWVRKVTVGENGAFMTVIDHNTNIEGGLWGSGIVTNTSTAGNSPLRVMNVSTTPCVFSGRILGKGIRWYSGGNVHLTGTNSNFTGTFQIWNGNGDVARRGTTGLVKIGNSGEVSSVGCTTGNLASREMGARFLYLGEGETTSRGYAYYNNHTSSSGAHYWDAGAHGGDLRAHFVAGDHARLRHRVPAAPGVQIAPAEPDVADPQQHLARSAGGLFHLDDVQFERLGNLDCFHSDTNIRFLPDLPSSCR
jgi:hypothetical protein